MIRLEIDFPSKQPPVLVANPEYETPGNPNSVRLVANNKRGDTKPTRDLSSILFAPENLSFAALLGTKAEAEQTEQHAVLFQFVPAEDVKLRFH